MFYSSFQDMFKPKNLSTMSGRLFYMQRKI